MSEFELDPCLMNKKFAYNGAIVGQGNCSLPNQCICLCFERSWLDEDGDWVEEPWVDPLDRELLPGYGVWLCVPASFVATIADAVLHCSCGHW